jgi:hypothetical protein
MSDPFAGRARGFRDLVPWADPYIASLVEKLRQLAALEDDVDSRRTRGELPPPLDNDERPQTWQTDWSPRNWPRS